MWTVDDIFEYVRENENELATLYEEGEISEYQYERMLDRLYYEAEAMRVEMEEMGEEGA